jgi:hypothetical protein
VSSTDEYVFDYWAVHAFQHDVLRTTKQWYARIPRDVSPR